MKRDFTVGRVGPAFLALAVAPIALCLSQAAWGQSHAPPPAEYTEHIVWQPYGYDVYPTGDDRIHVQWAIDNVVWTPEGPGRVLMKSHPVGDPSAFQEFVFLRPPGSPPVPWPGNSDILVCSDVIVEGEVRHDTYSAADDPLFGQRRMTEIHGGWVTFAINWPFYTGVPYCGSEEYPGFSGVFGVRDLVVRDGTFSFVMSYSWLDHVLAETTVENVKIVDLHADPWWGKAYGFIFHNDYGNVSVENLYLGFADEPPAYSLVGVATTDMGNGFGSALLEITNSEFDMPSGLVGSVGVVMDPVLDAVVRDNRITAGIGVAGQVRNHGSILDNDISARRVGLMGLSVDYGPLPPGAELPPSELPEGMYVMDNRVTMDAAGSFDVVHPTAGIMGIDAYHPGGAAQWRTSIHGTVFSDNIFEGQAEYGVYLGDLEVDLGLFYPDSEVVLFVDRSSDNQFYSNDFSQLVTSEAHVLLGERTSGNRFGENRFGLVEDGALAAVVIHGDDNSFVENRYELLWWWPDGVPAWWLTSSSRDNLVDDPALPDGADPVDYWVDEGLGNELRLNGEE